MNAIYKGKLYIIGDDLNQCQLTEYGRPENEISISFGDPDLIIDPTDDQVNNLLDDDQ